MTLTYYPVLEYRERVAAGELSDEETISQNWWDPFMRNDAVANACFPRFYRYYPELQTIVVENGHVIGKIECVPVIWDGDPATLPQAGWRWALQTAVQLHEEALTATTLCAVAIAMSPDVRGRGLSYEFLAKMADLGRERGYKHLLAPVRPSEKARYPTIPMEDYITWTRDDGMPYDGWLRVHVRAGGVIANATHDAFIASDTRAQWEAWTDLEFHTSGTYIVPGALNPVMADLEDDVITYRESNVWVIHKLD